MSAQAAASGARLVVMTGATNGIGARALHTVAPMPDTRVIVGARGSGRAVPAGVQVLPLDLSSLDSVRSFAEEVTERLRDGRIDALVLNAGTQSSGVDGRTADGLETTFGVNHLAHYLLARLLAPDIADGGRLIVTTSDTHDPKVTPMAPKSLDPHALAHPVKGGFGAGMRAYTSSKLCNIMTALSLARSTELAGRGVSVIAFNPGFTFGTNLGGRGPVARRLAPLIIRPIFGVVGHFKPEYSAGTPERAGEVLAELLTGALSPPADRSYVSIVKGAVTYPDPSELARDTAARQRLWDQSARMVGLPAT